MKNRIILPLDNKSTQESIKIIKDTAGTVWGWKLRRQILMGGLDFISYVKEYGNVMVDFKLFDIPSAMDEAAEMMRKAGANIITVHCNAEWNPKNPKLASHIAGVTVLTSVKHSPDYWDEKYDIFGMVEHFATSVANTFDYGYIVSSAQDLGNLNDINCKKICPGIRPKWYQEKDDQARTMTPLEAVKAGADYLVIGRPLLNHNSIREIKDAIKRTNDEIEAF